VSRGKSLHGELACTCPLSITWSAAWPHLQSALTAWHYFTFLYVYLAVCLRKTLQTCLRVSFIWARLLWTVYVLERMKNSAWMLQEQMWHYVLFLGPSRLSFLYSHNRCIFHSGASVHGWWIKLHSMGARVKFFKGYILHSSHFFFTFSSMGTLVNFRSQNGIKRPRPKISHSLG